MPNRAVHCEGDVEISSDAASILSASSARLTSEDVRKEQLVDVPYVPEQFEPPTPTTPSVFESGRKPSKNRFFREMKFFRSKSSLKEKEDSAEINQHSSPLPTLNTRFADSSSPYAATFNKSSPCLATKRSGLLFNDWQDDKSFKNLPTQPRAGIGSAPVPKQSASTQAPPFSPKPSRPKRSDDEMYWSQVSNNGFSGTNSLSRKSIDSTQTAEDYRACVAGPTWPANKVEAQQQQQQQQQPSMPSSPMSIVMSTPLSPPPPPRQRAGTLQKAAPVRPQNPTPDSSPTAKSMHVRAPSRNPFPMSEFLPTTPGHDYDIARIEEIAMEMERHLSSLQAFHKELIGLAMAHRKVDARAPGGYFKAQHGGHGVVDPF